MSPVQAVDADWQRPEDQDQLWCMKKTLLLVALQLADIKSGEVILQPAAEVPFALQYQHRTALVRANTPNPKIRKSRKREEKVRRCEFSIQPLTPNFTNASIWIDWNEQTWSPSCEASTSAGPHNWPSCANCRASLFRPETRRFCTSEAVAWKSTPKSVTKW